MDVIPVKLIKLLLKWQLFNAFPSSERMYVVWKAGGVLLKILHSINITIFDHPTTLYKNVQGTATSVTDRMFYQTDIVRVCTHLSAMKVAHRWNFVKNDLFRKSPSKNRQRGGASKCIICNVGSIFGGQFCDVKFFPLYGPQYGLRNFCSIFVRKHYNHLCLNLNNSKIWRRIPGIFFRNYRKRCSL